MADELVTEMRGLLSASDTEVDTLTSSSGTDPAQQDKKPMAEADANETGKPLFETVIAHDKGLGLFATRDIPRGTLIIEEAPLLAVPRQRGGTLDLTHLVTALRALNYKQYNKLFGLHRGNGATFANAEEILSQQPQVIGEASRRDEILDTIAIFLVNSVGMGPGSHYGTGIFEHYSRVNHACNPNVQSSYNPLLEKLTVHAVRQINKDEEILTSYIDSTCRTREERQNLLSRWGFECGCTCCTGSRAAASERRRSRMSILNRRLGFYVQDLQIPHFRGLRSPRSALKVCGDLLELYMYEDITDYNLAMLYRACSVYSVETGQFDKAVNYAKKERDVERYCLGIEISPRVKGADYWLQHVLGQREEDIAKRKADEKLVKKRMAYDMEMVQSKKKGGKGYKKGGKGRKKGGKGKKKKGRERRTDC